MALQEYGRSVKVLRQFPALPPAGNDAGIEWTQSMGKLTMALAIDTALTQDDIEVQMSNIKMEVKIQDKAFKPMTGDFAGLVRVSNSHWWLQDGTLVVELSKAQHRSWHGPWNAGTGGLNKFKRQPFYWTEAQKKHHEESGTKQTTLEVMTLSRPEVDEAAVCAIDQRSPFEVRSERFIASADTFCLGVDVTQEEHTILINIHFDKFALEELERKVALEDLFGADIYEDYVYIFLQGNDQNPIISGSLAGLVSPEETTWRITTTETHRTRQQVLGIASPTLSVKLVKAAGSRMEWPQVFSQVRQHKLMLKNPGEYEDMLAALEDEEGEWVGDGDDAEWVPNPRSEEEKNAIRKQLDNWQEARHEGVPNAQSYMTSGFNLESEDFWTNVNYYVKDTVKRNGYISEPQPMYFLGEE